MNAFFFFDLFMVYLLECKQQLRTMKQYDQIPDIVHLKLTLNHIINKTVQSYCVKGSQLHFNPVNTYLFSYTSPCEASKNYETI
jgi:hypothetical protein